MTFSLPSPLSLLKLPNDAEQATQALGFFLSMRRNVTRRVVVLQPFDKKGIFMFPIFLTLDVSTTKKHWSPEKSDKNQT